MGDLRRQGHRRTPQDPSAFLSRPRQPRTPISRHTDVREGSREVSDAAFEEFVLARQATMFRVAFLLTGERGQAEDLLQNALERTYQHWHRVRTAGSPDAYVRRIMVNLANDRWRSKRHVIEQCLDTTIVIPDHTSQADLTESRDLIMRSLRALPPRMRTVLVLRYFEELSEAETAAALDCSVGAVKSQTSRGLAKLRAIMTASDLGGTGETRAEEIGANHRSMP